MSFANLHSDPTAQTTVSTPAIDLGITNDALAAAINAALIDPAIALNESMSESLSVDDYCNSDVLNCINPKRDTRGSYVSKEFNLIPEAFVSALCPIPDLTGSSLRTCLGAIHERMKVDKLLIAAMVSKDEALFIKYFPALAALRRYAMNASDRIVALLREKILLFPSATASLPVLPTLLDIVENLLVLNIADEYGPQFRQAQELHAFRDSVDQLATPTIEAITLLKNRFDELVRLYPEARGVADAYLSPLFQNYGGEYQTELYAWLKSVRTIDPTILWRAILNKFTSEMASKINARKSRSAIPAGLATRSSAKVLALNSHQSGGRDRQPESAAFAGWEILARRIRAAEKDHGICSNCIKAANHTWKTCPDIHKHWKGAANLVQPDYYDFTGHPPQARWVKLHSAAASANDHGPK